MQAIVLSTGLYFGVCLHYWMFLSLLGYICIYYFYQHLLFLKDLDVQWCFQLMPLCFMELPTNLCMYKLKNFIRKRVRINHCSIKHSLCRFRSPSHTPNPLPLSVPDKMESMSWLGLSYTSCLCVCVYTVCFPSFSCLCVRACILCVRARACVYETCFPSYQITLFLFPLHPSKNLVLDSHKELNPMPTHFQTYLAWGTNACWA